MIYPATLALALLFTQAARGLPQPGSPAITPTSSTGSSYSSTPSPSSSSYSSSSVCPCYMTPTPYPPGDKNGISYSGSYPASGGSICSCTSCTPYPSSQPPYTSSSSYTSSKEPYATPYPPSQPPYTSSSSYTSSKESYATPYPSSHPPYTSSSSYTSSKEPYATPYPSSQPPYTSSSPYTSSYPSSQPPYTSSSSYTPSKEPYATPYSSSQPPYTSSSPYTSSKGPYQPTTPTPYPYVPPSKPSSNYSTPEPKAPSTTLRATFDTTYDNKAGSLNSVACSNGANGLVGRFPTFGDIPSFPFIGGAFDIVWNSPNCGGCWSLTNAATGVSINITAVDTAGAGFNIAQEAFVQLNGGQVGQGVVDVVATKVSPSVCGL